MDYEQGLEGVSCTEQPQQQQEQQPYLPRWQRDKMNRAKNYKFNNTGATADNGNNKDGNNKHVIKKIAPEEPVNDPCYPSANGYADYRNTEQIERQGKEAKMKRDEREQVVLQQHVVATQPQQEQPHPTIEYNVHAPLWFYRDNSSGGIQGPFSGYQMMGWKNAGFFPLTTPVRLDSSPNGSGGNVGGNEDEFVAMSEIDFMAPPRSLLQQLEVLPTPSMPPPPPPAPASVSVPAMSTVAAYPVDANQSTTDDNIGPDMPTASDDQHDAIGSEAEVAEPPPSDEEEYNEHDNAYDNEIDAVDGAEADMCVPPPSDGEEEDGPEVEMCVPPPSDDEDDGYGSDGNDDAHYNDKNQLDTNGDEPPAYYPPLEDDDNVADVPYPVDMEYPVPSDDEAVPYPVDVEYPIMDYPNTDADYGEDNMVPAVAPYPSTDDVIFGTTVDGEDAAVEEREIDSVMPPPVEEEKKKKKFEGDKDIVGFMPTNLRVKRKTAGGTKKPMTKTKATVGGGPNSTVDSSRAEDKKKDGKPENGYSVADDYDKFMDEISALK